MAGIRLVGCMITTNNMPHVRLALETVLPYVDEMLVVDGESSDGTIEAAIELGCRVVVRKWPGDNSSARQQYVDILNAESQADGRSRWALVVDSDEILAGTFDADCITEWDDAGYDSAWVSRKWLVSHGSELEYISSKPHTPDWQRRLLKIKPSLRYTGAIHEQCTGLVRWTHLMASELTIFHLDLLLNSVEDRTAKVNRYFHIDRRSGYPWLYQYERFGYLLKSCESELKQASYLEAVRALVRTRDTGNLVGAAVKYWLSPHGFFEHAFKPLGRRVKRLGRKLMRSPVSDLATRPVARDATKRRVRSPRA